MLKVGARLVLMALPLGACVTDHGLVERQRAAHAALAADVQANCPPPGSQFVLRAKCIQEAENRIVRPLVNYPDLLDLLQAYRVAIATKVEQKKLSQAEGELEFKRVASDLNTQELARLNSSRAVSAQEASARAQRAAALGSMLVGVAAVAEATRPPPIVPSPPPATTNVYIQTPVCSSGPYGTKTCR